MKTPNKIDKAKNLLNIKWLIYTRLWLNKCPSFDKLADGWIYIGESMTAVHGYNLALEFLQAQQKAFDFTETNINSLISNLSLLNDQNRELQKLIAALTHAKKDKKDADFSEDQDMQETIRRIHDLNPQIFGSFVNYDELQDVYDPKIYVFKLDDIETSLSLLDSAVKDQVSKVNETTMYINQGYEDRIQYTENAQKTLEMLMRHIDSILGKIRI